MLPAALVYKKPYSSQWKIRWKCLCEASLQASMVRGVELNREASVTVFLPAGLCLASCSMFDLMIAKQICVHVRVPVRVRVLGMCPFPWPCPVHVLVYVSMSFSVSFPCPCPSFCLCMCPWNKEKCWLCDVMALLSFVFVVSITLLSFDLAMSTIILSFYLAVLRHDFLVSLEILNGEYLREFFIRKNILCVNPCPRGRCLIEKNPSSQNCPVAYSFNIAEVPHCCYNGHKRISLFSGVHFFMLKLDTFLALSCQLHKEPKYCMLEFCYFLLFFKQFIHTEWKERYIQCIYCTYDTPRVESREVYSWPWNR
jgi:hypothetical protein